MAQRLKAVELFLAVGLLLGATACGNTPATSDVTNPGKQNPDSAVNQEASESQSPAEKANAEFQDQLSGPALVNALQQGGYITYFRHVQTEKDYADQVTADVNQCSTQRVLSETGWQQARAIGAAFRKMKIPVGKVISSQYCRAWQTADLAFGKYEKDAALNFLPFEDYTEAQTAQMKANVMPLLTALPATGTNTVIVGHDDIFEAATGIYPDPQGMAYVLKPDGKGNFELIANMLPEEWSKLSSNP